MHTELECLTFTLRREKALAYDKRTGVQATSFEIVEFVLGQRARQACRKVKFF